MNFNITAGWAILLGLAVAWELAWKGVALWTAAKNSHLEWFVAILLFNTIGILPITYVLMHTPKLDDKGGM